VIRASIQIGGALWLLTFAHILFPKLPLYALMAILLVAFVALALPRLARHSAILCTVLAAATVGLGIAYGQWEAILTGLTRSAIFPAFLATIVLLRATAEQRPEIARARSLFGALDRDRRDSGIVVGGLLIGSILQVGVFAILAPILGRDAPEDERRDVFTTAVRGMSMVPFWSPFIVGMAVASQYLPLVPLWQIMSLGLCMSAVGILVSLVGFDRHGSFSALWLSLKSFAPIAVPVVVAALVVVGTTSAFGLSTLQALVMSLPVLCLAGVLQVRPDAIRPVAKQALDGLGRIGTETSILVFATTLGAIFEASLPQTGILPWLESLQLPAAATIFIVVMTMNIGGLFGLHAIVTGTFLLVIFTGIPTGVSDLMLMQALLAGWGLASGISISSLSIATGSVMFRVSPTRLIPLNNIVYVFTLGAVVATILSALNSLFV
jgi:hypothetical protein